MMSTLTYFSPQMLVGGHDKQRLAIIFFLQILSDSANPRVTPEKLSG